MFFKINIFVLCFSTLSHAEKLDKETLVNRIFDRFQEIDEYVPVSKHKLAQVYDLESLKKMRISKLKDLDSKTRRWSDPDSKLNGHTSLACAFEIAQALMTDELLTFKANKTPKQAEAGCPRVITLYGWKIDAFKPIKEYLETVNVNNEFIDQDELRTMKNEFSDEQFLSSVALFEDLKKSCDVYLPRDDAKAGYIESVKEITGYFVAGILSTYVVRQFIAYWYKDEIDDLYRRVQAKQGKINEREKKEQRDRKNKKGKNSQNSGPGLPQDPQVQNPKLLGASNQGCMTGQMHAQSVADADAQAERRAAKMARREAEQQRQADIAKEISEAKRAEIAARKKEDARQDEIARKKEEDRIERIRRDREEQAEKIEKANRELEKYVRLINDALTELEKNGDAEGLADLGAIIASIAEIDCNLLSDESRESLRAIWSRLDKIGFGSDYQSKLFEHRASLEQYLFKNKIF